MKTIKKIFYLLNDREMYPYEEDDIRMVISEVLIVLMVSVSVALFYISFKKAFFNI